MSDRTITFSIVSNAIDVSTVSLRMSPRNGDRLRFTCPDGDFAVFFKNARSPHQNKKRSLCAHIGEQTDFLKIRTLTSNEQGFPVNDVKNGATFQYAVAVLAPNGHVLTIDPDIIIDDPGGGGRVKKPTKGKAKKKKK